MISLSTCIKKQSNMIGKECQNLGKKTGGSFFGKKVLISYDNKEGWKCVELTFFQLFLRKAFGFYESTHMFNVVKEYNQVHKTQCFQARIDPELMEKFDLKIHEIWSKAYHSAFPKKVWSPQEIRNLITRIKVEFAKETITDVKRAAKDFAVNLPDFFKRRSLAKINATQRKLFTAIAEMDKNKSKRISFHDLTCRVKKLTFKGLIDVYNERS
ncbi:MAG: hypothetical protein H0U49_12905 [Parachlamydiaceae bacterium]|nr:hypothetical protein [Parachlamydiaceae bacterium]